MHKNVTCNLIDSLEVALRQEAEQVFSVHHLFLCRIYSSVCGVSSFTPSFSQLSVITKQMH